MALRIRKNGRIFCAALSVAENGDTYLDDEIHYILSVKYKLLVTTDVKNHIKNKGEWWWSGFIPRGIKINKFYKSK